MRLAAELGGSAPRGGASKLASKDREALIPLLADLGHPVDRIRQGRGRDAVAHFSAGALALEQPGVGERVQVLDDGLARDRQAGGKLSGGGRGSGCDRRQQRAAGTVGQRSEYGVGVVGFGGHDSGGDHRRPERLLATAGQREADEVEELERP